MAVLHRATLTPTKKDLVDGWLPTRGWYDGTIERGPVASFRLDDPTGEVGMEGFLLGSATGSTLFLPLTYRGEPLEDGHEHLVGTSRHSVLGQRWIYDGCGDPVWARALATTIITGGRQADLWMEVDGRLEALEPDMTVLGSGFADGMDEPMTTLGCHDDGATTVIRTDTMELVVARVVGTPIAATLTLTATWPGGADVVLAGVRLA